jgi:hypothetical protein
MLPTLKYCPIDNSRYILTSGCILEEEKKIKNRI